VGHGLILFLGPEDSPTLAHLRAAGETVTAHQAPLDAAAVERAGPDWVISHGYRHILRADVLDTRPGRFVNLHISLLPHNRGADPNLWSWVDGTPKGVTVHLMDAGVDTGPLLAQEEVALDPAEHTLATSYAALQRAMTALFARAWPGIAAGRTPPRPQPPGGSVHRVADRAAVEPLLTAGWDTPVTALAQASAATRQASRSAP
jgi:methionyl-tRNA formyltransferase